MSHHKPAMAVSTPAARSTLPVRAPTRGSTHGLARSASQAQARVTPTAAATSHGGVMRQM